MVFQIIYGTYSLDRRQRVKSNVTSVLGFVFFFSFFVFRLNVVRHLKHRPELSNSLVLSKSIYKSALINAILWYQKVTISSLGQYSVLTWF